MPMLQLYFACLNALNFCNQVAHTFFLLFFSVSISFFWKVCGYIIGEFAFLLFSYPPFLVLSEDWHVQVWSNLQVSPSPRKGCNGNSSSVEWTGLPTPPGLFWISITIHNVSWYGCIVWCHISMQLFCKICVAYLNFITAEWKGVCLLFKNRAVQVWKHM